MEAGSQVAQLTARQFESGEVVAQGVELLVEAGAAADVGGDSRLDQQLDTLRDDLTALELARRELRDL